MWAWPVGAEGQSLGRTRGLGRISGQDFSHFDCLLGGKAPLAFPVFLILLASHPSDSFCGLKT